GNGVRLFACTPACFYQALELHAVLDISSETLKRTCGLFLPVLRMHRVIFCVQGLTSGVQGILFCVQGIGACVQGIVACVQGITSCVQGMTIYTQKIFGCVQKSVQLCAK
ncbi:MAG: hypothetical protein LBB43_06980, partial [Spirochaetaceae bacterium]|nr:hypothetical protein [Spirochaetaceae bacterium]